jgi:hypothetical protein
MAPSKKKVALLSSGEPAKTSMLSGPAGASALSVPSSFFSPRPTNSEVAWSTPTL